MLKSLNDATSSLIGEIAWLYYIKGMNQADIAQKMNLSRPTVIAHLKTARSAGIVSIKLDPIHYRLNDLSDRLMDTFSLAQAHVVPRDGLSGMALTEKVSEVGAHLLPKFLQSGDSIGVAWGQTLACVAKAMPHWPIPDLVVRQLIGSMGNPTLMTAESCTTDIARSLDAQCINLNTPAVVSSNELANKLQQEPIISQQLDSLKSCNKSIFSLSLCTAESHVVQFNVATASEVEEYVRRGAVCNFVGRFLDAKGKQVDGPLDNRVFAAKIDDLRAMEGMMIIAGAKKAEATLAALRGNFVSWLVIDDRLAAQVLAAA